MYESFENIKGLLIGQHPSPESSLDYRIDDDHGRVYVRFVGRLTANLIERYAEALKKNLAFEPGWSEIVMSTVTEIEISADDAIRLADQVDPFSLSSRRAFVVTNDLQRHSARMQQILRSPSKTMAIFDSMVEAEKWVSSPMHAAAGAQVLAFPLRPRP